MTNTPEDRPGDRPEDHREQPPGPPPGGYQPPPPGYGPPPPGQYEQYGQYGQYPPAAVQYAPDHPKATTVLVLGILGVVVCQVLGPFAWSMGKRTVTEIDASGGRLGGRGVAQAGYILGIVGTVLLGLSILALVAYVVFMVALVGGGLAMDGTGT